MMDLRRVRRREFAGHLQPVALFREENERFLGMQPGAPADWLA
jgi:hypothetical protein